MAQIKSQNENSLSQIRQLVIPDVMEVIVYALIASFLLLIFNAQDIWDSMQISIAMTDSATGSVEASSSGVWDKIANSSIPQLAFWAAIGAAVYALVWFVWNIVNNFRNDIAANSFVHPRHYDKGKFWESVLAKKALFVICTVLLIVYLAIFFNLISLISNLAYSAAQQFAIPTGLVEMGIYLLLATVLVYVLVLIYRLAARTWDTIYKDL